MKLRLNVKSLFLLLLVVFIPQPAQAQTITENQPLDFGRYVMSDNTAPRTISLLPGGGFTADPQYIFFVDPQLGNITVDSYPALTTLTVTVGTTVLSPIGGGPANFSLGSTFTNPAIVTTDATGSATFDVGAIITSDGGGSTHSDDTYNGIYSVTVTP